MSRATGLVSTSEPRSPREQRAVGSNPLAGPPLFMLLMSTHSSSPLILFHFHLTRTSTSYECACSLLFLTETPTYKCFSSLYICRRFLSSPNFTSWFSVRKEEANQKLRLIHLDQLCKAVSRPSLSLLPTHARVHVEDAQAGEKGSAWVLDEALSPNT